MRTAARPPFHALRSALVALTVISLAAGAHAVAGGQLPSAGILLAFFALTGLAATAATRLRLTFPAMAGLLGAGQVVLHEAFTVLGGQVLGGAGFNGAVSGTVLPHHSGATSVAAPIAAVHGLHGADPGLSLPMLAGHALATLACAALLARGEDALWSLAAWLRPLVQLPAPAATGAAAAPAAASRHPDAVPLPWRNHRPDCRRGPPAAVVVS